jgi:ABC-type amino acid transport substrate-binding protein
VEENVKGRNVAGKWMALLLVAGVLALAGQAGAGGLEDARHRGKLLVGVKTDFPPFGYVDAAGIIQGFDVDVARYMARALFEDERRLELVPVTSGSRIPFLYSGWIDIIIATMTITDERLRVLEFSDPYFVSGSLLLVLKESPIRSLEDLKGKAVAVIAGAVQEKDLKQAAPGAKQVKFPEIPQAIRALKRKEVDAFCQDDVVILTLAGENSDLQALGKPFIPRPYAMAVQKGDLEFIRWVNERLNRMKSDGTTSLLWQKHFGRFGSLLVKP